MEFQQDFKELLELFNAHKVEYIIVGDYALAFHGAPRYTGDIDIFIKPEKDNAHNIFSSLCDFGFGSTGITAQDFTIKDNVIQLGVPPVRVDIITSLTGITWEEASEGRVKGRYADANVFYLGRKQLISNKRTLGRKRDLADLEALGEE